MQYNPVQKEVPTLITVSYDKILTDSLPQVSTTGFHRVSQNIIENMCFLFNFVETDGCLNQIS